MTSAPRMNRDELFRLAAMDGYGLLDEYEAALYTRSFHDAPASVQDELIALQARLAVDPLFLAGEEPAPVLREKVLDRVLEAIEAEQRELAPLATIGRNRKNAADAAGQSFRLAPSSSVLFWRAACFMLLASLVVVLYMYAEAVRKGRDIAERAMVDRTTEQLKELIGADFLDFVNHPGVQHVVFQPVAQDTPGQATAYLNPRANAVFLNTMGLREGRYELRVTLEDGSTESLGALAVDGTRLASIRLDGLKDRVLSAISWVIIDQSTGLAVLTA